MNLTLPRRVLAIGSQGVSLFFLWVEYGGI